MADPIVAFPIVDPQEDVNQLNQVYSSEYLSSNHNTFFNEMTANERLPYMPEGYESQAGFNPLQTDYGLNFNDALEAEGYVNYINNNAVRTAQTAGPTVTVGGAAQPARRGAVLTPETVVTRLGGPPEERVVREGETLPSYFQGPNQTGPTKPGSVFEYWQDIPYTGSLSFGQAGTFFDEGISTAPEPDPDAGRPIHQMVFKAGYTPSSSGFSPGGHPGQGPVGPTGNAGPSVSPAAGGTVGGPAGTPSFGGAPGQKKYGGKIEKKSGGKIDDQMAKLNYAEGDQVTVEPVDEEAGRIIRSMQAKEGSNVKLLKDDGVLIGAVDMNNPNRHYIVNMDRFDEALGILESHEMAIAGDPRQAGQLGYKRNWENRLDKLNKLMLGSDVAVPQGEDTSKFVSGDYRRFPDNLKSDDQRSGDLIQEQMKEESVDQEAASANQNVSTSASALLESTVNNEIKNTQSILKPVEFPASQPDDARASAIKPKVMEANPVAELTPSVSQEKPLEINSEKNTTALKHNSNKLSSTSLAEDAALKDINQHKPTAALKTLKKATKMEIPTSNVKKANMSDTITTPPPERNDQGGPFANKIGTGTGGDLDAVRLNARLDNKISSLNNAHQQGSSNAEILERAQDIVKDLTEEQLKKEPGWTPPPASTAGPYPIRRAEPFVPIEDKSAVYGELNSTEQRYIDIHRDNLYNDKFKQNEDGSITTIAGTIVLAEGGEAYLVPGYDPETGKVLSGKAAFDRARGIGLENFPVFRGGTPQENVARARAREMELKEIIEQDMHQWRKEHGMQAGGEVPQINKSGLIQGEGGPTDDNIPMRAEPDSFIVNAPAVEMVGKQNLDSAIHKVQKQQQQSGFNQFGNPVTGAQNINVSNGEYKVSKKDAERIGYDNLNRINDAGKPFVEQIDKRGYAEGDQVVPKPVKKPPYEAQQELINAVIYTESAGQAHAKSDAGAIGLMQIMPKTAAKPGFGVKPLQGTKTEIEEQLYDREINEAFGTEYLNALLNRYGGNIERTMIAYNAGPGRADKYKNAKEIKAAIKSGKLNPKTKSGKWTKETLQYIEKINNYMKDPEKYKLPTPMKPHPHKPSVGFVEESTASEPAPEYLSNRGFVEEPIPEDVDIDNSLEEDYERRSIERDVITGNLGAPRSFVQEELGRPPA